jgi:hypothetical protein
MGSLGSPNRQQAFPHIRADLVYRYAHRVWHDPQ